MRLSRTCAVGLLSLGLLSATFATSRSVLAQRVPSERATPILWRDPGFIATRDLYWGNGGADQAPQTPFTFLKEDTGGTKPKVQIKDAAGVIWNVKLAGASSADNEVHAEVAASRLMWAFGYLVEESYYIKEGVIEGFRGVKGTSNIVAPDGRFQHARFEKRPPHITRLDKHWTLDDNPFVGSKELSGLKIVVTLLSNRDLKPSNTAVLRVAAESGRLEDWFVLSDLGTTFGYMGTAPFDKRSRWNLEHYREQKFIDAVDGNVVGLHYRGTGWERPLTVPLDHARWFAGLARQLTAAQVRQAFDAAGASPSEIDGFSARVLEKIDELRRAVESDGV